MSIATSLFAKINGITANDFASGNSAPFDPATYRPTQHVVTPLDLAPKHSKRQVTVFAIFNEPATTLLHSTTDIHAHNLMKLKLRTHGHSFHTSHASALLKLQARKINEAVRQKIAATKAAE
jgi:hypothetical protein